MIQKSSTTLSLLLTKPSSANCATMVPLKRSFETFKVQNWWRPDIQKSITETENEARKLSILGQRVATRNYAYLQRLFALVKQQGRCSYATIYAKYGWFLPQKRNWHVEVWMYFAQSCKYSSPHVSYCKILVSSEKATKIYWKKKREDMVGGPSKVFTWKIGVHETLNRDPTSLCKSFVEFDAIQLYPFSMCQALPTGPYKRWELHLTI